LTKKVKSKALQKLSAALKNPFKVEDERKKLISSLKVGTLIAGWEFYCPEDIKFSSPEEKEKTKMVTVYPPRQSWHTYSPEPVEMYAIGISGILLRCTSTLNNEWEIKWLGEDRDTEIWSAECLANSHLNCLELEKNNFTEMSPRDNFMDWNNDIAIAIKIIQ